MDALCVISKLCWFPLSPGPSRLQERPGGSVPPTDAERSAHGQYTHCRALTQGASAAFQPQGDQHRMCSPVTWPSSRYLFAWPRRMSLTDISSPMSRISISQRVTTELWVRIHSQILNCEPLLLKCPSQQDWPMSSSPWARSLKAQKQMCSKQR